MTTSSLKSAAPTSQNLLRNAEPGNVRASDRRIGNFKPRVRPSGAARRFLSVLMNSLSAWAV